MRASAEPDDELRSEQDETAREIARLQAEVALRRERVGASFEELRQRVQGMTSWRQWAASHPLGWIGAGVSLGFIVGCLAGRRSRSEP
ncbi:MAG TPA: hypothetical protein VH853_03045 [Polyangia bacterium]|jgi:hypothetical protein|nr:hypothetical protein [Polyangia bacterium]